MMFLFLLLFFWIVICVLMTLYDINNSPGFAVVALLPLSIVIFIIQLIGYIEDVWFYDKR